VDSTKVDSTVKNLRATSAQLEQLARDVKQTNAQMQGVLDKVSTGSGTAAKLLNDPAVYARLDTLLLRVDSLVMDLKKNPKKYINLRIF
jgi:phospholipid/cholesterol/gamma-HCH transport system substrate-binding protein